MDCEGEAAQNGEQVSWGWGGSPGVRVCVGVGVGAFCRDLDDLLASTLTHDDDGVILASEPIRWGSRRGQGSRAAQRVGDCWS